MNGTKLVEAIKLAGIQAMDASKPVNIFVGKVISTTPLEIAIEQTNRIGSDFLVIAEKLTDRFIYMTNVDDSFDDITDTSKYKARKKYALYKGLKKGDAVILARATGGQKYYVIDRVGAI